MADKMQGCIRLTLISAGQIKKKKPKELILNMMKLI